MCCWQRTLHHMSFHVLALAKHPFTCVCFRKTVFPVFALARHPFTCVPQQNIIWHNWLSKELEVSTSHNHHYSLIIIFVGQESGPSVASSIVGGVHVTSMKVVQNLKALNCQTMQIYLMKRLLIAQVLKLCNCQAVLKALDKILLLDVIIWNCFWKMVLKSNWKIWLMSKNFYYCLKQNHIDILW